MRELRAWIKRLRGWFNKRQMDRELDDEIESHIQMHVDDNLRLGMSLVEARRRALMMFGGIESTKEAYRDQRGLPLLDALFQDVRYGARMLRKNPGFTTMTVLTLALGIGINAGVFTILNAAAFRSLPVQNSDHLVSIYQSIAGKRGPVHRNSYGDQNRASYSEYREYRDFNHVFSGLLAYAPSIMATLGGESPQIVCGALVSCNYFDVLKARPALGRGFIDPDCAAPGESAVVVLSHDFWRRVFQADPSIVGKEITLNHARFTVVGIAPSGFRGTEALPAEFWAPLTMQRALARDADILRDDFCGWLILLGRVQDGISIRQVRGDVEAIASRIDQTQPGRVTTLTVRKATLAGVPEVRTMVLEVGATILIAVGLVLVIACANIANLLLARGARRSREIAVRLAIGASRERLVRQLLTESLLLALAGGVLGSFFAIWSSTAAIQLVQSHLPHGISPFILNVGPDIRVLGYAVLLTLITGFAFGLVPAMRATKADLSLAMKDGGPQSEARPGRAGFLRNGLIVAQVAGCMILLLITGLLVRGLFHAETIDPGYRMKNIAVASFDLASADYNSQRAEAFQRELVARVASLPGVDAVAQAASPPLSNSHFGDLFSIAGQEKSIPVEYNHVSASYFPLLEIPIVRGRNFTESESRFGGRVTIVTESTARRLWAGKDAIGRTIRKGTSRVDSVDLEIVGVAKDAQVSHLAQSDNLYLYLPPGVQEQSALQLLVSSSRGYAPMAAAIRAAVRAQDRDLIVSTTRLEENFDYFRFPGRVVSALSAVLGTLALLLASTGIYGTVSYVANGRLREIAIRMALGAEGRDVMALLLRQAMRPVLIGVLLGLACCAATSSILSSMLYGISPHDPISFIFIPGFLLMVALFAVYLPTRRAAKVHPMAALRCE